MADARVRQSEAIMDEWRPHQIPPPEESEFQEMERRRRRQAPKRRWLGPLLLGAGTLVVGVMSFSVCAGSDPTETEVGMPRSAQLTDGEVTAALEAGLERRSEFPLSAEAATSSGAGAAASAPVARGAEIAPQPETPDVAAPGPPPLATPQLRSPGSPPPATPDVAAPGPPVHATIAPAVPAKAASAASARAASGAFSVQLVSVRDPASAHTHWDAVVAQYPDLFAGLSPSVQRADLGAKGTYHRLRVGPFPDRASATQTCDEYKVRGGSCLVVAN